MATDSITSIADKITKDGTSGYKAEKGRYHLYVSLGCPYAHRSTMKFALKIPSSFKYISNFRIVIKIGLCQKIQSNIWSNSNADCK